MSRVITDGLRTEVIADELTPALFVKFEFDSGDLNLWSGLGDKIWNSSTYTGAGSLVRIDKVTETQDLRANSISFGLSGIPSTVISLALTSNYQGRAATMWFGVLNTAGAVISDPYEIFKGRIDIISFTDSGETSDFVIKCESNAIDIRKAKLRRFTDEDQKIDYPNDKGLEFIAKIQDIDVVWG